MTSGLPRIYSLLNVKQRYFWSTFDRYFLKFIPYFLKMPALKTNRCKKSMLL